MRSGGASPPQYVSMRKSPSSTRPSSERPDLSAPRNGDRGSRLAPEIQAMRAGVEPRTGACAAACKDTQAAQAPNALRFIVLTFDRGDRQTDTRASRRGQSTLRSGRRRLVRARRRAARYAVLRNTKRVE